MAKPTAIANGTNSERTGSAMMNAGMNTDRMQSMANSRGTAVSLLPRSTARASERVRVICTWMFSIDTVASSTSMPIDRARPPSVMMLIVAPLIHSAHSEPSSAMGMLNTTTRTLRQSCKNSRIIRPVKVAPMKPSTATLLIDSLTVGDSSNS